MYTTTFRVIMNNQDDFNLDWWLALYVEGYSGGHR